MLIQCSGSLLSRQAYNNKHITYIQKNFFKPLHYPITSLRVTGLLGNVVGITWINTFQKGPISPPGHAQQRQTIEIPSVPSLPYLWLNVCRSNTHIKPP